MEQSINSHSITSLKLVLLLNWKRDNLSDFPIHFLMTFWQLGNSLVIAAIFKEKTLLETAGNDFVINLAIADITMGLGVMIPTAVAITNTEWVFGEG